MDQVEVRAISINKKKPAYNDVSNVNLENSMGGNSVIFEQTLRKTETKTEEPDHFNMNGADQSKTEDSEGQSNYNYMGDA